jgi:hypothetical protein
MSLGGKESVMSDRLRVIQFTSHQVQFVKFGIVPDTALNFIIALQERCPPRPKPWPL